MAAWSRARNRGRTTLVAQSTQPLGGLRGYIGSVATDEDWRRQGIGRQVIEYLIEMLHRRGVAEIDLHATEDSEGLYRAIGFVDRDAGADLRLGSSAESARDV